MSPIHISFFAFVLSVTCCAQQVVHRSTVGGAAFPETDFITPLTPFPDPVPNAATPRLALLPGLAFPLGDLTMDNTTGLIWETNGTHFQATPNGRYPTLAAGIPPTPTGLPPLTGLAINSASGTLYCTDGIMLYKKLATPPFPATAPPVPLAFPAIAPPFTGLEYSPGYDLLYACDAGGYVYYFTTDGLPSGPNPVFTPPAGVPPATDLAARPEIIGAMLVQFLGLGLIDYTSGSLQPAAMNGIPPGTEGGIAFHAHPASIGGGCPCAPAIGPMVAGVTAPAVTGASAFGFTLAGGPPSTPVLLAADFGIVPTPIGGGCTYFLPYPPVLLLTLMADASGSAVVPIAIPSEPFLIGFTVAAQWAAACPSSPSGFAVSDAIRSILAES
jgi:hypothetical protein